MDTSVSTTFVERRAVRRASPLEPFAARLRAHSSLTAEDEVLLAELSAHPAEVRANADLLRLSEQADHACLVVEGIVARFIQNKDGSRQTISTHLPGELADLQNVVLPRADSWLQALGNVAVLRIPLSELRTAIARSPALTEAFWREYALEAARVAESVVNVGRRQALSRTAHLLCEMAWRNLGRDPDETFSFGLAITQTAIADILGLTSVHVNRMLRSLADGDLVRMSQGMVHISDWSRLATLGEFVPDYLQF